MTQADFFDKKTKKWTNFLYSDLQSLTPCYQGFKAKKLTLSSLDVWYVKTDWTFKTVV